MFAGIRSRLTYANVMATIAVFIALGGTAWAAARINSKDVINNSLKSVDLKNNSLKSVDLKNRKAVKGADVARDSLGGAAIDESSLDLAAAGPHETIFMGSSGGQQLGGDPRFLSPSGSSGGFIRGIDAAALAPVAMVATDLAFEVSVPPGMGAAWTLRLLVNGVPTFLACSVEGDNSDCSDSETVPIDPMDSIALQVTAESEEGPLPPPVIGRFGWRAETPSHG